MEQIPGWRDPSHNTEQPSWYARVLQLYADRFWFFVSISLRAVALSYIALQGSSQIVKNIWAHVFSGGRPRSPIEFHEIIASHRLEVVAALIARWSGFLLTWLIACFAFGAVAVAVQAIADNRDIRAEEAYSEVREGFGAFFRSALVLFVLVTVIFVAGYELGFKLLSLTYAEPHSVMVASIGSYAVMAIGSWLLVRFAFVFPVTVLERASAFTAFQRSEALTEPFRVRLFLLVVESEILGYVGALLPYWIFSAIPRTAQWPQWIGWVLVAFSIIFAALAQLPMMIGISQAYLESAEDGRTTAATGTTAGGNLSG